MALYRIVKMAGATALIAAGIGGGAAQAQQITYTEGLVTIIYADPSDVVYGLDKPGRCGSSLFHLQRNQTNFKEGVALVMMAFNSGRKISAQVVNCSGDRNITGTTSTAR